MGVHIQLYPAPNIASERQRESERERERDREIER